MVIMGRLRFKGATMPKDANDTEALERKKREDAEAESWGADMAPSPDALDNIRPREAARRGTSPFTSVAKGVPEDLGS